MKKGKRVLIGCLLMLYVFSGCRLAKENMGSSKYEDRFVGFFITYEYLDLFDIEGYLNDNIASGGFNITVEGNTEKYEGRLYAQIVKGESHGLVDYVFPDIEGISCFTATIPESEGNNSYITSIADPGINDIKMNVTTGDEENSTIMSGDIYVSPRSDIEAYYFNPVYQSTDGSKVYLTAGGGMSVQGIQDEGLVMSNSMESETTVTENGKVKTEKVKITVSVNTMIPPSRIAILQMDESSNLIMRTEYESRLLPESIDMESEVAYFIVEQHKQDAYGEEKITREIYGKDDETVGIFSAGDNGICIKNWIQINW